MVGETAKMIVASVLGKRFSGHTVKIVSWCLAARFLDAFP